MSWIFCGEGDLQHDLSRADVEVGGDDSEFGFIAGDLW